MSEETTDRAIGWHVRLSSGDATEAEWMEFTAWLEADPAHRTAYDQVDALDAELAKPEFVQTARRIGTERRTPRMSRTVAPWAAGVALLAASLLVFLYFERVPAEPTTYATAVGESKTIDLADGTQIKLNTATVLSVDSDDVRHVTLERGEALFQVAKNSAHPFVVTAGDRKVRVVGTVFNVLRNGGTVAVVVVDGRVAVSDATQSGQESVLTRGDRLVCAEHGECATTEHVDAVKAIAWREGYLIYRDATLSAVISDLNRYFPTAVVAEGDVGVQRFTGVLRIDNQDAVLRQLAQFLPVTVQRRSDGKIGLRPSPTKP